MAGTPASCQCPERSPARPEWRSRAGHWAADGIAVGAAFRPKRERSGRFAYNLLSDGELGEGSIREAVTSGLHHKLDNLIAVVGFNNQQADGRSQKMLCEETLDEKWVAFGWHVQRVEGSDIDAIAAAFNAARALAGDKMPWQCSVQIEANAGEYT